MAETILARVARLLSGKVEDCVDAMEKAGGTAVMREAIREVDRAIDLVRSDLEAVMARRLQAVRQQKLLHDRVAQLTEKAKFAVGEGRDDLAEAALSRQIDFEQQAARLDEVSAEAREEELKLETSVAALKARKKQMEDALSSFLAAQSKAATGGDGPARVERNVEHQVARSEQAFERAMAGAGGVGFTRSDVETINRVSELDVLQKSVDVAARIARMKQAAGA